MDVKINYNGEIRLGRIFPYPIYYGGYAIELKDGRRISARNAEFINETNDSAIETLKHKIRINELITRFAEELEDRSTKHDSSKLSEPEKSCFDNVSFKLSSLEYGSDEYNQSLAELKPALDHHYQNNSHHPEHYENGIEGMDLFDLVEMFFDWKSSAERHETGDVFDSIRINQKKHQMSEQLVSIFLNTARNLNESEKKPEI